MYYTNLFHIFRQTVCVTDRFYFRKRIIFSMLSTENIISLINIKKVNTK